MLKAIIFDLFGTLTTGNCNPEAEIIKQFHLNHKHSAVEKLVCGTQHKNYNDYFDKIINGLKLQKYPDRLLKLFEIFDEDHKKDQLLNGLEHVLREIKEMNLRLAILSNMPNDLYKILERHHLDYLFEAKIYSHEVGLVKPSKEIFEIALKKLNENQKVKIKSEEALMIGDSMGSDIRGAENVGIQTLLADYDNKFQTYRGHRVTSLKGIPEYVRTHFLV